jgi:hypothetical protein
VALGPARARQAYKRPSGPATSVLVRSCTANLPASSVQWGLVRSGTATQMATRQCPLIPSVENQFVRGRPRALDANLHLPTTITTLLAKSAPEVGLNGGGGLLSCPCQNLLLCSFAGG